MYATVTGTTDFTAWNTKNVRAVHLAASTAAVVLLRNGSSTGAIEGRIQVPASPGPSKRSSTPTRAASGSRRASISS